MSQSSPSKVYSEQDKRATSIFKIVVPQKSPSVSHFPNFTIDKENKYPQFRSRQNLLDDNPDLRFFDEEHFKRPKNYVELTSREDCDKKYKFPIYSDRDIGIGSKFQRLLQESYENDDDIDTKQSVMEYFIDVCKQDLLEGIRMNSEEFTPASFAGLQDRLKIMYQKIDLDSQ